MKKGGQNHWEGNPYKRPGSPYWHYVYTDASGVVRRRSTRTEDLRIAREALARRLREVEKQKTGYVDRYAETRTIPVAKLVNAYQANLKAQARAPRYVKGMIREFVAFAKTTTIPSISLPDAERFVCPTTMTPVGAAPLIRISPRGLSERLEQAIQFAEWDSAKPVGTLNWKPPRPLVESARLPPFPIDAAFPAYLERLREFAVAASVAYQVPVDAVAMLLLPVLALPLSKRFEVEPQPGWREQLSVYAVVLLPSGDRKTAVMSLLTSPIYAWQRDQTSGLAAAIAEHENELGIVQERLRGARKQAAKRTDPDNRGSNELSRQLARLEGEAPRIPQLIATEATTEAIAQMLVENHERGLIAAAEGDALDVMLGRYSGAPNFGVWLSGHSGDPVDSFRRGRCPDQLAHPALQVALCVQPQAVSELIASQAAEGRGLLARIFFSVPKSLVGYRELTPPPIPSSLLDWYGTRLQSHLSRVLPLEPAPVRLDPEASELLLEFRRQNETDLRLDGALGQHRSWGSKLPGGIVRIAGIFRTFVAGGPTPTIDAETMRCALAWAPYLTDHYQGVLHLAGDDAGAALASRIDRWIRRRGIRTFSRRDAFSQIKGAKAPHVECVDPALDLLVERNRIRLLPSEPRTGPGRRPSASFEVNPALLDLSAAEPAQNPHNPQNPGAGTMPPEVQR